MRERLFRDPVHDLILLDLDEPADDLLFQLIDTPEVQRLRRIRQIGMASVAFHGAEHSRFSHSLGVMHIARRILDRLDRDATLPPLLRVAVQCAALLHDVGHGPFSHVIEKFFEHHHEWWTRSIILDERTQVHHKLAEFDPALPQLVADVLTRDVTPSWVSFIISSQLDADRFDYLLRDSHMTGVKYGVFDLERLLMLLKVSETHDKVVVAAKGILPVEKYLQSRYQMYRQVYFHKTVTAAESMLMAVLHRACDHAAENATVPGVEAASPFGRVLAGRHDLSVSDYLQLDDSVVLGALNSWSRCSDAILADLADALLNRRLFKSLEIADHEEQDLEFRMRVQAAEDILREAGQDPRYYLLYSKSADTPYRPYHPRSDRAGETIWIEAGQDSGSLKDVKDVSATVRALTESPYTIWRTFFPAHAGEMDLREPLRQAFNG